MLFIILTLLLLLSSSLPFHIECMFLSTNINVLKWSLKSPQSARSLFLVRIQLCPSSLFFVPSHSLLLHVLMCVNIFFCHIPLISCPCQCVLVDREIDTPEKKFEHFHRCQQWVWVSVFIAFSFLLGSGVDPSKRQLVSTDRAQSRASADALILEQQRLCLLWVFIL